MDIGTAKTVVCGIENDGNLGWSLQASRMTPEGEDGTTRIQVTSVTLGRTVRARDTPCRMCRPVNDTSATGDINLLWDAG